ncbi:MAG TPA: FHA domain-containing protein [Candidatus Thiothrix moscowensis]|uniref:FHA domain-containing protein n=1 Tax=unclassified Thiothrix TaxID=2636184 RepID=UPI0025D71261|nr:MULTISPECIES: FHA domain-containing protein [unclassified Thiothrix]HRJ53943.1 FHA domain-containing protein [Candidatus Thiothrix moscowensis]HRJ94025.1 FHA domain-containing protein [Candidatus Thiothrix moscowensis]
MSQLVVILEKQVIKRVPIKGTSLTFGRNNHCEISLPDRTISNRHARITVVRDDCFLEDLDSTNGTYVNQQLVDRHLLEDGDTIGLGKYHIQFESDQSVDSQIRRLSVHPKLMDATYQYWLQILNGKRSGYIIPLQQERVVLGNRRNGQILIEPNAAGLYSMQEIGMSNSRLTRTLIPGEELRVEDISFRFCLQDPNVPASFQPGDTTP